MHNGDVGNAHGISRSNLERLELLLASKIGLHFPQNRSADLIRRIQSASKDLGFDDMASCVRKLISSDISKHQVEVLARHFTVGETYFFRDKPQLEILEQIVLPELINARRYNDKHLKLWSAGCSTGEEAYTLAMLIDRIIPDHATWNVCILATDANVQSLEEAKHATYKDWSFRSCDKKIKDDFFEKSGPSLFTVIPDIRNMVVFSYVNLAEDSYPSLLNNTNGIDVIVCKNVLMYFEKETASRIVDNFSRSLMDGGWLITSAVEMTLDIFPQFEVVRFPGVNFFRKRAIHETIDSGVEDTLPQSPISSVQSHSPPSSISPPPLSKAATSRADKVLPTAEKAKVLHDDALALYKAGRYAEAAQVLEKTLSGSKAGQPPDSLGSMELLTRAYANLGDLKQAEAQCRTLISHSKLDPQFRFLHASILQALGRTADAKRILREVIYLDSGFTLAHFSLGNIAWKESRQEEATRHFNNALGSLRGMDPEEVLAESDGMTVGRIAETLQSFINQGGRT